MRERNFEGKSPMPVSSSSAEVVENFLRDRKLDAKIRILAPESTRTSVLAAEALGCSVAQIAKTIAFFQDSAGRSLPILVTLSGDKRVSLSALANILQITEKDLRKMNAQEVKRETGFSIGGVPPFPLPSLIKVIADASLFRFEKVWAAAGSTNAVMELSPLLLTEELKFQLAKVSE